MKLQIFFSKSDGFAVSYELKCAVRAAILATLKYEGFPFDAEVSVTFADNEYIHGLNNEYRGMDKPTDVLSFPMYDDGFPYDECQHGCTLGDIVISLEKAEEQANELGHGFVREATFLAIHSTLHLLGYDHERSKQEDKLQCEKQQNIINKIEF